MAMQEQSFNAMMSNAYAIQSSALQMRLDSSMIVENIELFLRGAKIVQTQDDEGKILDRMVSIGKPRANDSGIQAILNWSQLILNPQVVQGNFPIDGTGVSSKYEDFMYFFRIDLTYNILVNLYLWEVEEFDVPLIVDSICSAIEPFMTRLIGNLERTSYNETMRVMESNTMREQAPSGFRLFGGGK